jgi:hypothetical protein
LVIRIFAAVVRIGNGGGIDFPGGAFTTWKGQKAPSFGRLLPPRRRSRHFLLKFAKPPTAIGVKFQWYARSFA